MKKTDSDWSSAPKTSVEMLNERDKRAPGKDPVIDWIDWTRRLQQALGALLAETVGQKEPDPETWDMVQAAIELEAEAASRVG